MNVPLHGHNPEQHIVAVQQLNDQQVRQYRRRNGKVTFEDVEFFPFFFLSDPSLLSDFKKKYWLKELAGRNYYNYLAVFTRWNDMWDAVRSALELHSRSSGKRIDSYAGADVLLLRPDPISQFLMQSGITLFKDMAFADIHRMQISIATYAPKGKKSDPRKTEDRVLAVGLSDNLGWEQLLDGRKLDEPSLLRALVAAVLERDPDILEGHNLFGRDLPYLMNRFALHEIDFGIGRDGSEPKMLPGRWTGPEGDAESGTYDLAGRHLVDTLFQTETYDFSKRSLETFDLHILARHFGFESPDRQVISPHMVSRVWDDNPQAIIEHIRQNVREIRLLSDHLSPSSFYLAQMVPLSYGSIVRTGSAMKIESLLLREYLRQKHSIPKPEKGTQTTGGYSDIFWAGVFSNVVHADVESLYPSIILSRSIVPRTDELSVFLSLLRDLVTMRLETKRALRTEKEKSTRAKLDALQSAFKILINSFYGYLGYARGLFNDYQKADEITKSGQELLRTIVRQIELYNGQVLEVDTDGVFFIPPDNIVGETQEEALIERISETLPGGIKLVSAGRYKKMVSYKKKNYALLDHENSITIRGSALISRSMERFLRRFLRLGILNLLDAGILGLHNLYVAIHNDIAHHQWEVYDFCRTETIHDAFPVYEQEISERKRNPAAAYEVARLAGLIIKPGDRISYYVTGTTANIKISENCKLAEEWDPNFADENSAYYLARLEEAAGKFEPFFAPTDFRKIFTVDDLFGFDPEGVTLVSQRVASEDAPSGLLDERERAGFRIWLGEQD